MSKKSKKEKIETSIHKPAVLMNNIQRLAEIKNPMEIRSVIMRDENDIYGSQYKVREDEEDKIMQAFLTPGSTSLDKKGYVNFKFDDGSTGKYEITEIIMLVHREAERHIMRYYSTLAAYESIYKGKEYSAEGIKFEEGDNRADIDKLVVSLYDGYNTSKDESEEERREGIMYLYEDLLSNDFVVAFHMWEALKKLCKSLPETAPIAKHILEFQKASVDCARSMDDGDDYSTLYKYIYGLVGQDSSSSTLLRESYGGRPYSDNEIFEIMTTMLTKDEIKGFIKTYGAFIVEKKGLVRQLVNKRYITEEELHQLVDKTSAYVQYSISKNKELLKYIGAKELAGLYFAGEIKLDQFTKNITLEDLLLSGISKENKLKILRGGKGERVYNKTETSIIWELFEKDYFTLDEIKELEALKYLNISTIIKNYNLDKARKIAAAIDVIPNITDEKLLDFFTADIILREYKSGMNSASKDFYSKDLRAIYESAGRNFEVELTDCVMAVEESEKAGAYHECLNLYEDGFLSIESLKKIGIPETVFENDYFESKSDDKLIEYFNSELVSQDTVIELLDEDFDEKSFELISKGMSARIIEGFYSTKQLIEMTKSKQLDDGTVIPPKLTYEQLADIKSDIITGLKQDDKKAKNATTLLDMYMSGELLYSELYGLKDAGVITDDEANEINDQFNLDKGVELLKKSGISGQPLQNLFKPQPMPGPNPTPTPNPGPKPKKSATGIDGHLIVDFYKKMGATTAIQIDSDACPVFEGYVIIPIVSKKIGFLEGADGRTYILPLKIILEQINNPRGQMDLIGNATSRNGFNSNKNYVRSTNHTMNWVENTVKKAAEISPVMTAKDARDFKKNNAALITAVRKSYVNRRANPII